MAELTSNVSSPDGMFGTKAGSKIRKLPSDEDTGTSPLDPSNPQIQACPDCKSVKVYLDGKRPLQSGGEIQRYVCRVCGRRFSDKPLKSEVALPSSRQICAEEAKNLHVTNNKRVGTGEVSAEARAAITVFEGWLRKEGYKKNRYASNLVTLLHLSADLNNPEDVKAKIAEHNVNDGMKMLLCYSYEAYLTMQDKTWKRPTYHQEQIKVFAPQETDLDTLISAARSHRMAAFLQTLKETFTDPGEALQIEWTDINGKHIAINHPVKGHRSRILEVSCKLIGMLNLLPNHTKRVFNCQYSAICHGFNQLKKRVAHDTQNPRLLQIELRSFRHWAGTQIAEQSNGNPMTVMKLLGLKSINNAMKYVDIWQLSLQAEETYEYVSVTNAEELKIALLGGYQFIIEKFGASWFRRAKRKIIVQPDVPTLINKAEPRNVNAF